MVMKEKKRILIVDDEVNVTTPISMTLETLGDEYDIDVAHDGTEAFKKVQETSYDLVLTDYQMPKMNGIKLAQHIRELSPDTQVIMMTAYGSERLQDVIGSLQLDGYIEKPVRLSRIRKIVQEALTHAMEGDDAFRTGESVIPTAMSVPLQELRANTGARSVLLLSGGGYLIEQAGETDSLNISTISTLVAANFMATSELAKQLGDRSVFKSSYLEGPCYNIYSYRLNKEVLLAVIFGMDSKIGIIRYYTNKTVNEILPLLDALNAPPDDFHMEGDFGDVMDNEIDMLFSGI